MDLMLLEKTNIYSLGGFSEQTKKQGQNTPLNGGAVNEKLP